MKGTLHRTEEEWLVSYSTPRTDNQNGYYIGRLPVLPDSLSNPYLSTYWVDGREVEFDIVEQFMPYDNFNPVHKFAKVKLDYSLSEETLDYLFSCHDEDDFIQDDLDMEITSEVVTYGVFDKKSNCHYQVIHNKNYPIDKIHIYKMEYVEEMSRSFASYFEVSEDLKNRIIDLLVK